MKAYTDLEQSKVLAKILPLESADMFWYRDAVTKEGKPRIMNYMQIPKLQSMYYSPCWSLAALLSILPNNEHITTSVSRGSWKIDTVEYLPNTWWCEYEDSKSLTEFYVSSDNPVDACYEMVIKLHERKVL